jgi:hypothetical protein
MEKFGIVFRIFPYFYKMIIRVAQSRVLQLSKQFKVIAVTGPRQSGKTTLVKSLFPSHAYVSLENSDTRQFAIEDPRGFLASCGDAAILDEIQRTPDLFSYLQEIVDNSKQKGKYILTGSNNFLLQQNISQSLSGRVGYMNLLPFSISELKSGGFNVDDDNQLLFNGFYPPIYDQEINSADWCRNYLRTYVERDVRQIKNITDLIIFERFLRLCAGRVGQELNMSAMANETGIDMKTIQSWIGVLENSFVIYLLRPYYQNFNKTIVKRPKFYFYDTGLVCSLLGIASQDQLLQHYVRGSLFENMIIAEMIKNRSHLGENINLYYWRDKTGHEIDIVIDDAGKLLPIEIKSGKTINSDYFKNLIYWNRLSKAEKGIVIYGGDQHQKRSNGMEVVSWKSANKL